MDFEVSRQSGGCNVIMGVKGGRSGGSESKRDGKVEYRDKLPRNTGGL
jgi:hypothetical protein